MFTPQRNLKYDLNKLPAMPAVAAQTIELLNSQSASAEQIALVVGKDPVVTARVLKIANSSYYSMPKKVTTLSTAIVVLGQRTLKALVMAASLRDLHRCLGASELMLWEDSLTCALASRFLAKKLLIGDPEETFIAGLFRHIGKLVLCLQIPSKNPLFQQIIKAESDKSLARERTQFGTDHAKIGATVLKRWQLNDSFSQVAQHHHDAEVSHLKDRDLINMICLVNITSRFPAMLGVFGLKKDIDLGTLPGAKRLNLGTDQLAGLLEEFIQLFENNRQDFLS